MENKSPKPNKTKPSKPVGKETRKPASPSGVNFDTVKIFANYFQFMSDKGTQATLANKCRRTKNTKTKPTMNVHIFIGHDKTAYQGYVSFKPSIKNLQINVWVSKKIINKIAKIKLNYEHSRLMLHMDRTLENTLNIIILPGERKTSRLTVSQPQISTSSSSTEKTVSAKWKGNKPTAYYAYKPRNYDGSRLSLDRTS